MFMYNPAGVTLGSGETINMETLTREWVNAIAFKMLY